MALQALFSGLVWAEVARQPKEKGAAEAGCAGVVLWALPWVGGLVWLVVGGWYD